jgi:hypothetical protein
MMSVELPLTKSDVAALTSRVEESSADGLKRSIVAISLATMFPSLTQQQPGATFPITRIK